MPRKTTTAELQAEEAATSSPLRRSSRIVSGTGTSSAAAVVTRRTSQTSEPQSNTPAKATRGRRASAQDSEEKAAIKPVIKTRRASLAEEELRKEIPSTPTKRTRKPSLNTEEPENEDTEKPKPVRGRRTSTSSTTEEPDEIKTRKAAPLRGRRSSANMEPETEVNQAATKVPARATTRRSSATEDAVFNEISTPLKRATRSRKISDAEEIGDTTEIGKKSTTRGRKKSVDQEEEPLKVSEEEQKPTTRGMKKSVEQDEVEENKELVKPALRRGRKPSTEDPTGAAPKTTGKLRRRPSINEEEDSKGETEDGLVAKTAISPTEEDTSPLLLKEALVHVAPLKKRKIVDKMEELDLSVINESSDDIDNGTNGGSREVTNKIETEKDDIEQTKSDQKQGNQSMGLNRTSQETSSKHDELPIFKEVSVRVTPLKKRKLLDKIEEIDLEKETTGGIESENEDNGQIKSVEENTSLHATLSKVGIASIEPSDEETKTDASESSNKRAYCEIDSPSPRKSPRLTQKYSRQNTHKEEEAKNRMSTAGKARNLIRENEVNEKSQASFVSSGSDGSFKFHLSNVSLGTSQQDLNKETTQEEVINTSTESNKENIEEVDSLNVSKDVLDISAKIPIQEPIRVCRVSNVFKPNQKDYSFMEPMEVDDSIMYADTSVADKSTSQVSSSIALDSKVSAKVSAEVFINSSSGNSLDLDESSVIFNYRASDKTKGKLGDISTPASRNQQKGDTNLPVVESTDIFRIKQNLLETEGSDTNLLIEETEDAVNFSIKPKSNQVDNPTTSIQRKSKSSGVNDASLVLNQHLEEVKVVLLGKSSSPIVGKRNSKSPVPEVGDGTDSVNDVPRRSKSPYRRSLPRSPGSTECEATLKQSLENLNAHRSKSKSKSPSSRRSSGRSPSFLRIDNDDKVNPTKSKSPTARYSKVDTNGSGESESKTPISIRSSAKSPNYLCLNSADKVNSKTSKSPIVTNTEIIGRIDTPRPVAKHREKFRKPVEAKSESSLPDSHAEEIPVAQDNVTMSKSPSQITQDDQKLVRLSKGPLPESTFFQNLGILKDDESSKSMEKITNAQDKDISDSLMSKQDTIESEHATVHGNITAVATTNNESGFNSVLNMDDEVIQSQIEHSDVTHYDFELDSDEDLVHSKENSVIVKQTLHLQKKVDNQSPVVEELKPLKKSISPKSGHQKLDEIKISSGAQASEKQIFLKNTQKGEPSVSDPEEASDNDVEDRDILPKDSQSDDLEKPSKELIDILIVETEIKEFDDTPGNLDSESASVNKSTVANVENPKIKKYATDFQNVSNEGQEDILQEDDDTEQNNISDKRKSVNRNERQENQKENEKRNESMEEVTGLAGQKVSKTHHDNITKSKIKKYLKSRKTKPALDDFASARLAQFLNSREELAASSSEEEEEEEEESESEANYNEFIDGMAEEGEEDTPSEDSNQIIDEGESVGSSSDAEFSDDDYEEDDSFICDEEYVELLSGDEYDLDNEKKKKKPRKSRIIDPAVLGDGDIIIVPRKKNVEKKEQKKRSRIISVSDSSGEEQEPEESAFEAQEKTEVEDVKIGKNDQTDDRSVILIDNSIEFESSNTNLIDEFNASTNTEESIKTEEFENGNTTQAIIHQVSEKSSVNDVSDPIVVEKSNNDSAHNSILLGNLSTSLHNKNRKSSLSIQENILVDGVQDPLITQRINNLVESFCSTVKQGEISLNLSLEYEGEPQVKEKKPSIRILSDIKISPSPSSFSLERNEQEKEETIDLQDGKQEEAGTSTSLDEDGDLREVLDKKNLKRKLSKGLDDLQGEVNECKRRRTHTTDKMKKGVIKKDKKSTSSKIKKRDKLQRIAVEHLKSTISSFGIMNQLVTDVKNRPKRTIKPTKTDVEVESSWTTTKVTNLKPSTSPVTKDKKMKIPLKLHPKDFKNQMLSDETRVKRIDTKTLLKKKGAF